MQIVIKLDEGIYEALKNGEVMISGLRSGKTFLSKIFTAVANGTPLPKGHEKLIAKPTEEDIAKTVGGKNDFAECIRDAVKVVFDNAPTIIEADGCESTELPNNMCTQRCCIKNHNLGIIECNEECNNRTLF